jgi:hypothetical protein
MEHDLLDAVDKFTKLLQIIEKAQRDAVTLDSTWSNCGA